MADSMPAGAATRRELIEAANRLSAVYLKNFPRDSARKLESMEPADTATILSSHPPAIRHPVWALLNAAAASRVLTFFDDPLARDMLISLDRSRCAALLGQLETDHRDHYLGLLEESVADELRNLLDYPLDSAGHIMDTRVLGLNASLTVADAMSQLKRHPAAMRRRIFILDDNACLQKQVQLVHLVTADPEATLGDIGEGIAAFVSALDRKADVASTLQRNNIESLPVVDANQRLIGVILGANAIETIREEIAVGMQTMVGASREEQALSSSLFAVRKRQVWLQINLLTAFLAAAVVGLFESTIAQFTALAVLMPVAAGQSGNTGAQALAVTMRGLTLREITPRHWYRVMRKESIAGLVNGLAIALTCGLGVYLWSGSSGLTLVISLAMIISMTIAGTAGALVPIALARLGQDPAQSSSIILTTITDIAGFLSFLGIASALSMMLLDG